MLATWHPFCSDLILWTHRGLVTSYGAEILVNIGSGNGLLCDGSCTSPLPEHAEPVLNSY